jgi:hypothetical protein
MNGLGWLVMIGSWTFIILLTGFCMRKVIRLSSQQAERIHPIYEIDTRDDDQ